MGMYIYVDNNEIEVYEKAAKEFLKKHRIEQESENTWLCWNGGSCYCFWVTVQNGFISVYGDVGDVIFSVNDRKLQGTLGWLRGSAKNPGYFFEKLRHWDKFREFSPKKAEAHLHDDIKTLVEENTSEVYDGEVYADGTVETEVEKWAQKQADALQEILDGGIGSDGIWDEHAFLKAWHDALTESGGDTADGCEWAYTFSPSVYWARECIIKFMELYDEQNG